MPPHIAGLSELVEVGRGAFGTVYRADDAVHARTVAVKVLRQALDRDGAARFERECRAAGSLSGHPNIVSIHGSGVTDDGDPYLVMDHLPGGSLAERVEAGGPLAPDVAIELGVGLAGALAAAHDRGIVHRDVKPENVLYSAFGVPQLVDFGIARMADEFETRTAAVAASLSHAPPEVIAGGPPSPTGDVYSLASVLVFALTGRAPFQGSGETTLAPLIARISTAPPPDLRAAGVPDALAAVIERALAKDPGDRVPSAAALGEELREAARQLGQEPPQLRTVATDASGEAPPVSRAPTQPERPSRNARRVVLVAATLALVVAGASFAVFGGGDDDDGAATTTTTTPAVVTTGSTGPAPGPNGEGGAPAAPTAVVVRDPAYLGGDTGRVSVSLSWHAPSESVTGYRIRRQEHWNGACDTPEGEAEPETIVVEATERSTQNADTLRPCSWISWEVAAVEGTDVSAFVEATGVVPDVRGQEKSYHLVRAIGGLAAGPRGEQGCGLATELGCATSPSAGTNIEPGTVVAVYLQP